MVLQGPAMTFDEDLDDDGWLFSTLRREVDEPGAAVVRIRLAGSRSAGLLGHGVEERKNHAHSRPGLARGHRFDAGRVGNPKKGAIWLE
jgi:hypothetical protein